MMMMTVQEKLNVYEKVLQDFSFWQKLNVYGKFLQDFSFWQKLNLYGNFLQDFSFWNKASPLRSHYDVEACIVFIRCCCTSQEERRGVKGVMSHTAAGEAEQQAMFVERKEERSRSTASA